MIVHHKKYKQSFKCNIKKFPTLILFGSWGLMLNFNQKVNLKNWKKQ